MPGQPPVQVSAVTEGRATALLLFQAMPRLAADPKDGPKDRRQNANFEGSRPPVRGVRFRLTTVQIVPVT